MIVYSADGVVVPVYPAPAVPLETVFSKLPDDAVEVSLTDATFINALELSGSVKYVARITDVDATVSVGDFHVELTSVVDTADVARQIALHNFEGLIATQVGNSVAFEPIGVTSNELPWEFFSRGFNIIATFTGNILTVHEVTPPHAKINGSSVELTTFSNEAIVGKVNNAYIENGELVFTFVKNNVPFTFELFNITATVSTRRDSNEVRASINMEKAKNIHRDKLRALRLPLFNSLDSLYAEANSKRKNTSVIRERQEVLRNITGLQSIDSATTPEQLLVIGIPDWSSIPVNELESVVDTESLFSENGNEVSVNKNMIMRGDFSKTSTTTTVSSEFSVAYTLSQCKGGVILRDCNGAHRLDIIPRFEGVIGESFEFIIRNVSSDYKIVTLTPDVGVAIYGCNTVSTGNTRRFLMVSPNKLYCLNDVQLTHFQGCFNGVFSSNTRYVTWSGGTSSFSKSVIEGLFIGRKAGRIVGLSTMYLDDKPLNFGSTVSFDVGKINGTSPVNDNFFTLLSNVVVWNDNTEASVENLSIPFSENDKLTIRVRTNGAKQSNALIHIVLTIEFY